MNYTTTGQAWVIFCTDKLKCGQPIRCLDTWGHPADDECVRPFARFASREEAEAWALEVREQDVSCTSHLRFIVGTL